MKDMQLVNAIKQNNTAEVKNLLVNGANANTMDENGLHILGLAMASQNIENVKLLLRHGADANFKIAQEIQPYS
jgi:ankyrin repeat protein